MSLVGNLSTMPVTDVLQWLATAGKTGTLQVEHDRITKWLMISKGRVVGCSTDDPPQRLGQFLIAREKITEAQLSQGLVLQEKIGGHLGQILVEMKLISPEDLAAHLESKAEETIYSLFDWDDGIFRFVTELEQRPNVFPVNLQVQDVLLRGLKRYDEMKRIRELFKDSGIMLDYTSKPPGPEIFGNKMSRKMYSLIDGERSIADILLQVHGSEYLVYKFLYDLHSKGYVEIVGIKEAKVDPPPTPAPAPEAPAVTATPEPVVTATAASAVAVAPPPPVATPATAVGSVDDRISKAQVLMSEKEFDRALEVLDTLYKERPDDESLRRMTSEAEAAFVDHAYLHIVPADKVPVLTRPVESLSVESLSPQEFFLLSRLDGTWNVKSIIQVSPLREVDALRTLKRMREIGVIELRDPD